MYVLCVIPVFLRQSDCTYDTLPVNRSRGAAEMVKRVCGNCRFFEKSSIGETGHCSNERCRDIVGIALVRKHELACRVGWDQDYYEPLANLTAIVPGQNRPPPDATRPRGYQGMRPDDMVVAVEQTRPVKNELTPSTTPTPAPAAPSATSRSRQSHVTEAHRRALERKQLAQQSGTPLPARRLEGVLPGPVSQTALPNTTANTTREWEEKAAESVSLPRRLESAPPDGARPAPFIATTPVDVHAETTALPVVEPFLPPQTPSGREDRVTAPALPQTPFAAAERGMLPPPGRADMPPALVAQPAPAVDTDTSAMPDIGGESARFPLPEGADPGSLLAQWYLAERRRQPGKRCGNCGDFRPAETGSRGYCRNRFAFLAPPLVGPNDLACLSCLGNWWAVSDEIWFQRAMSSPLDNPPPPGDRIPDDLRVREERERPERHPYSG